MPLSVVCRSPASVVHVPLSLPACPVQSESIQFLLSTINAPTSTSPERATALLALGALAEVTGRSFAHIERVCLAQDPPPPPGPTQPPHPY